VLQLCDLFTAANEASQLREEASLPIEELLERYGGAGLLVNRAFASMKKGGAGKILSPVIRAKPSLEGDAEGSVPEDTAADSEDSSGKEPCVPEKDDVCVNLADSISNGFCKDNGDGDEPKTLIDTVDKHDSSLPVTAANEPSSSSSQENGTVSGTGCDSNEVAGCSGGSEVHSSVDEGGQSSAAGSSSSDNEPRPSSSTSEVQCSDFE